MNSQRTRRLSTYKTHRPLCFGYEPTQSKENLTRAIGDIFKWIQTGEIDSRRAGVILQGLEVAARILGLIRPPEISQSAEAFDFIHSTQLHEHSVRLRGLR